jgi:ankyrin repeat protein
MNIKPLPARPNLEQYRKQAKDLVKKTGSKLADAQFTLAREHGFDSWPKFAKHIEALARKTSPISKFEQAAEAIIAGDAATLTRLLRENPKLIRARSTRVHRATLLHYIAANGFEDYRQKTPTNAVEIAKILLDAGAEVDAISDSYGGKDTTLVLVATSIHPKRAGVQIALLQLLLDHSAVADGVNPCLRNGRPEAAEFLAQHGAPLDLEAAAGLGRLELVQKLIGEGTSTQINCGLWWASEYGRNSVIDFLLDHGADLRAGEQTALPALHWAIVGGQLETVKLLLKRGASLEAKNQYGGTALGQAHWCVANADSGFDYAPIVKLLVDADAK